MLCRLGYTSGGLGKNGQGIITPIKPEMRSFRARLGYGKTPFPNGGHYTELQEAHLTAPLI